MKPVTALDATALRGIGPAVARYVDAMPPGDLIAFPLTGLDTVGIPVWTVAFFPDDASLHGLMPYGVGYGLTDEAAILGSIGEAAEMLWPTLALRHASKITASYADLVRVHGQGAAVDPLLLCLPAGSPVDGDTVMDWVEARRKRDGVTVLVPIEYATDNSMSLTPGYHPFTKLITNGMGAGPDLDWAVGHGLCELLQRDGNGLCFRALDQGVIIDMDGSSPVLTGLMQRFERAGIEALPKFASDQFGLPNVYCVGRMIDGSAPATPIMVTACGEGCHPDREIALEKALCEFAASRVRKAFAHGPNELVDRVAPEGYVARFMAQAGNASKSSDMRAFDAMRDWTTRDAATLEHWLSETVLSARDTKHLSTIPTNPAADAWERGRIAQARIDAEGFDLLYVDLSPADRSIAVAKAIVPRLEVETMSYYCIGERNTRKLIEMGSELIQFEARSDAALRPVRLTEEAKQRLGGQPYFDTALADRIVGPLYPLYREPEAHHVAQAEEQDVSPTYEASGDAA